MRIICKFHCLVFYVSLIPFILFSLFNQVCIFRDHSPARNKQKKFSVQAGLEKFLLSFRDEIWEITLRFEPHLEHSCFLWRSWLKITKQNNFMGKKFTRQPCLTFFMANEAHVFLNPKNYSKLVFAHLWHIAGNWA